MTPLFGMTHELTPINAALALMAATANATSNVLQRKANLEEPSDESFSVRLVWRLAHNALWLGGVGAVAVSFLLQAVALGTGTLAAVEPIIVFELPLTLVAATFAFGSHLSRAEFLAIGAMTGGLGALLVGLGPRGPAHPEVHPSTWLVGVPVTTTIVLALVLGGMRATRERRALLFGCATGIEFGMTAALMKGMTSAFSAGGIVGAFESWTTYAMVAAGILGMFLMQNALQAGRLVAAQPGITLLDPITAVAWGVIGFHEHVNGGLWWGLTLIGFAAMSVGAVLLGRSPILNSRTAKDEGGP
jgi:hypothetical protein